MDLMGGRVSLSPRPAAAAEPVLPACFIGHCPGAVRPERLRPAARAQLRAIGFGSAVDHLDAAHPADASAPLPGGPSPLDADTRGRLARLHHLPLPLKAAAELDDLFPEARGTGTGYKSALGGERAWLPAAVDDFFANGGELAWIIVVPVDEGRAGLLGLSVDELLAATDPLAAPRPRTAPLPLHEPLKLRGLALALGIADIGLVALPDLERLQVPPALAGPARVRLPNPAPTFLPCGTGIDDTHRERRHGAEMARPAPPVTALPVLDAIANALAAYRPDLQCLLTLPPAAASAYGHPVPDPLLLRQLAERSARGWARARRLQLLWPYLRDDRGLLSAVGAVAGAMAAVSAELGPWRSTAGVPLAAAPPYPPTTREQVVALREQPGIGVLSAKAGRLSLDDERLLVPALPATDAAGRAGARGARGWRSGEVQRFMGWLMRRLRVLGETLVFDADPDDPRVALLLERFFRTLHDRGALRGAQPQDAFTIRPLRAAGSTADGLLGYEIELAPAFPLDRLRLTFVNRAGEWQPSALPAPGRRAAA